MRPDELIVVGGGLIGLAIAWRTAEAGTTVTVVDPAPGRGTSHVAGGMLAPVTEVAYGEEDLLALTMASQRRWASFAADLEAASELPTTYRPDPTLLVGADADDLAVLDDLRRFQTELGLRVERLSGRECRRHEPLLHPRVRGGLLASDDHHVDPRATVEALLAACRRADVRLVRERVAAIDADDTRVHAVRLANGDRLVGERVVLAAGPWSGQIDGLPEHVVPPVRPVKGQVVVLRGPGSHVATPTSTVRAVVHGRNVYAVPRPDGRLVLGATQEERGFDATVTAGGVRQLLDDAVQVLPVIDELEVVETLAGLRPGTPDNRPIIGATDVDGLLVATGHHRHGVLLTPVTADAIAALVTGRDPDPVVEVAQPDRFQPASSTTSGRPS